LNTPESNSSTMTSWAASALGWQRRKESDDVSPWRNKGHKHAEMGSHRFKQMLPGRCPRKRRSMKAGLLDTPKLASKSPCDEARSLMKMVVAPGNDCGHSNAKSPKAHASSQRTHAAGWLARTSRKVSSCRTTE
jgi:hypothetical protein